jgi:hypothetical protein
VRKIKLGLRRQLIDPVGVPLCGHALFGFPFMHDYLRKKKGSFYVPSSTVYALASEKSGKLMSQLSVKCTSGEALHGAEFSSRTMACVSHEKTRTSALQQ